MDQINLTATLRTVKGHQVKQLRRDGLIPAELYGNGFKNISLSISEKEFKKVFAISGSSAIVNLKVDGETYKILIHEPQKNPVSDRFIHVDLYKVNMKEEIRTEIPLKFVGTSDAVENMEGNLITAKDALEIECLPDKLVHEIEVDISSIKTFDDIIKVGDITIPEGIKVLNDAEELVAQVTPPRSEEELESIETPVSADEEKAAIEGMEAKAEAEKAEEGEKKE